MIFWQFALAFLAGMLSFAIFLLYWRKGQFVENEDVKYQMFREEECQDTETH